MTPAAYAVSGATIAACAAVAIDQFDMRVEREADEEAMAKSRLRIKNRLIQQEKLLLSTHELEILDSMRSTYQHWREIRDGILGGLREDFYEIKGHALQQRLLEFKRLQSEKQLRLLEFKRLRSEKQP